LDGDFSDEWGYLLLPESERSTIFVEMLAFKQYSFFTVAIFPVFCQLVFCPLLPQNIES
jgi:hypothetical protein